MKNVALFCLLFLLALPLAASAQMTQLVNIPGLEGDSINNYVVALFYLAVGIAAMLAVVKLVIAGAKYMFSDVANTKQSAIADIQGSVLGLLLILATVIILNTISTSIVETDVSSDLPQLRATQEALEVRNTALAALDAMCSNYGDEEEGVRCIIRSCGFIYNNFGRRDCAEWCNEQEGNIYIPGALSAGAAGGTCYWPEADQAFIEDQDRQAEIDQEALAEVGIDNPEQIVQAFIPADQPAVPGSFDADMQRLNLDPNDVDVLFYAQPTLGDYMNFESNTEHEGIRMDEATFRTSFETACRSGEPAGRPQETGSGLGGNPVFYCFRR